MASDLVDTYTAVAELIDVLINPPTSPPSLYVDLEGVNLSRNYSKRSGIGIIDHNNDYVPTIDEILYTKLQRRLYDEVDIEATTSEKVEPSSSDDSSGLSDSYPDLSDDDGEN
ncbi:hypothetical protein G7Y89_g6308 [Cudoniella acicularis]|uniref:Uncharacterized protein n=1 Tax=Cudoniella acicularis TaxID=354080 RepID=A0A8H4RP33_9HELO|nr:hypothetical protein G7Y89_g6308 [Cudoniella acicularis]